MRGIHYWPDDWDVGRKIRFLDCTFTRTSIEQSQNISVEMELEAQNDDEAMDRGINIILKECDLFVLCADNLLYLDYNYVSSNRV